MKDVASEYRYYSTSVYGDDLDSVEVLVTRHAFYSGVMVGLLLLEEGLRNKRTLPKLKEVMNSICEEAYTRVKLDEIVMEELRNKITENRHN